MKARLLVGTAFLGLVASEPAARATPVFDFTYSGSLVTFTVPATGTYQILAFGAQGGNGEVIGVGGLGAEIGGDFTLTAGEILQIAVGGAGSSQTGGGGGGGGGSFVVGPGDTPLVIAGGGGGGGAGGLPRTMPLPGGGGLTGPDGGDGGGSGGGDGGTGGNGGGTRPLTHSGGGGGGFLSAGAFNLSGGGGGAFPGLVGGDFGGGFGGGGGVFGGAGGGGGYSGGGAGFETPGITGQGGGGGSFDAGIDQILVADFNAGNGEVVITELLTAIPEPASIALLSAGLAGFAMIRRRRSRT